MSATDPKEEARTDDEVYHIPTLAQETLVRVSPPKEEDPIILLRVQSQQHPHISYMTSPSMPLTHVLRDYCRRTGLIFETVRFHFDGDRVQVSDTPERFAMEDGDAVYAFIDQLGGGLVAMYVLDLEE